MKIKRDFLVRKIQISRSSANMTLVCTTKIILLTLCLNVSLAEWVEIPQNTNFKGKDTSRTPKIKPIIRFESNLSYSTQAPKKRVEETTTSIPKILTVSKINDVERDGNNNITKVTGKVEKNKLPSTEKSFPINGFVLSGLMPYIEHLQEKVLKHLPKGITNKIRMLEKYRDNLFASIEQKVRNFWPPLLNRQRRTLKEHHHHHDDDHMDFPSAEGALITISFLTFSLFLTKLVLQVIQVLKAKQYNTTTNMQIPMGFMTANSIKEGRNARKFSTSDIQRYEHILRSISPT